MWVQIFIKVTGDFGPVTITQSDLSHRILCKAKTGDHFILLAKTYWLIGLLRKRLFLILQRWCSSDPNLFSRKDMANDGRRWLVLYKDSWVIRFLWNKKKKTL